MAKPVLYAMRSSLYSSKARSYLLKQGIDYTETPPGDPAYAAEVTPAIGRWIIPVLKTADGRLIQDTEDIIDHLDAEVPADRSVDPDGGVLSVLSRVLSMFGSEGLMRPALHFRWNFDEHNMPFVLEDFGRGLVLPGGASAFASTSLDSSEGDSQSVVETRAQVAEFAGNRMRDLTVEFGVNKETIPEIERSYSEFLALLSAHLERAPYLLGGRPTRGDFAFMGPLYAHLSRDPYPQAIMKRDAWPVWSWTERMMVPISGTGQYGDVSTELFTNESIPQSLKDLLAYIGREFADEVRAHVGFIDGYLAENPEVAEGDVVAGKATRRSLGKFTWAWRGHEIETHAIPYRVFHLQRIQQAFAQLDSAGQKATRDLLAEAGLEVLLDIRPRRRVERADNREVWGAAQEPALGTVV
ncbi:MAG: glutathione S-transferase N-terminal domain-containing protein [Actinomycetes bacterium]